MMFAGRKSVVGFGVAVFMLVVCGVAFGEFTPINQGEADTWENRVGLWVCPKLVDGDDVSKMLPLRTRLYATCESVTGGSALRVEVIKGSKGEFTMECKPFVAGSAGLTFYAKASGQMNLSVAGRKTVRLTKEWKKYDLTWAQLGTNKEKPSLGWQFAMGLASAAVRDCWYIIDRLGCEGPEFEAAEIDVVNGPDKVINTSDVVGNIEVLAATAARLEAKEPVKIHAFGDSVSNGSQCERGNWSVKKEDYAKFLYFGHLARLLNERYEYEDVTYVQHGYGGWTSRQALDVVDKVVSDVKATDVFIIEFGANDLGWANKDIAYWFNNMTKLIAKVKEKTSQIVIMSPTVAGKIPPQADEITRKFRAFAKKHNVAYMDVTRWSMYRGEGLAWAYMANSYHPDFMGHIMMAEVMEPMFTGEHFDWPGYVGQK